MRDEDKTKEQLIDELVELRRQNAVSADDHRRITAALEKSEARYRTLMEGIRDGVCILDTESRFSFVNDISKFL